MSKYISKRKEFRDLEENYNKMFEGHTDTMEHGKAFNTSPYYEKETVEPEKKSLLKRILSKLF